MNRRVLLMISGALNVLLLAFILKAVQEQSIVADVDMPTQDAVVYQTNVVTRTLTNPVEAAANAPLEIVWPTWGELMDEDWFVYRDNLMAIGCPNATIRQFLGAELGRLHYEERRRLMQPVSARFWDLIVESRLQDSIDAFDELEEQFKTLEEQYDGLGEDLFSSLPVVDQSEQTMNQSDYGHLEEGKQTQILALETDHQAQLQALRLEPDYRDESGRVTDEAREKMRELTEALGTARRQLMTEEEYLEYRLRTTGAANWARSLGGFEPTVEELRQVAVWQMELNENHPVPNRNDPNAAEMRENRREAETEFQSDMKELLGEERYADYERAQEDNLRGFSDLVFVFDLPEQWAVGGYEIREAAVRTAEAVRGDDAFTPAQKREALRAIQQETTEALTQLLGPDYYFAYERKHGNWLQSLGGN